MSFGKADQLVQLAAMAAGRFRGITIDDVIDRFGTSKRTAQRMLHMLELCFPNVTTSVDDSRRKRWTLKPDLLRDLLSLLPEELAALELATKTLERFSPGDQAAHLRNLRDKIVSLVPRQRALRIETDYDALLEAQGLAARPGPRPHSKPAIMRAITEAIKACVVLNINYRSRTDSKPKLRRIQPYGILTGTRRYLVARTEADSRGPFRMYRVEEILSVSPTDKGFTREAGFTIGNFARRSFGVFQNEEEYGEVIWRIVPEAAAHAREFEFHPDQKIETQRDGSVIVRFHAAGHLEMCWHLYSWGDKVEVLAPRALRKMCEGFRRDDFPGLP